MRNCIKLSLGWSELCSVLIHAVIGMIALSAASCRSHHTEERTTIRGDSLQRVSRESVTVETLIHPIMGDSVGLTIPMKAILSLPDGAEYSSKQGRTRLSLKKSGDNLIANATTDSVAGRMTRVEHLARDTLQKGSVRETEKTEEKTSQERTPWLNDILLLLIVGLGVALVVYKARKGRRTRR